MHVVVIEAEKFEELVRRTTSLETTLAEIRDHVLPARRWFDREACAKLRSRPRSYFDQYPHLLPNWGIPEDWLSSHHGHVWKLETVMAWVTVPLHEIERRWSALDARERAAFRKTRLTVRRSAA